MTKIFTFNAHITTEGTVSIEAETLEEAVVKIRKLDEADSIKVNIEIGAGHTSVDHDGYEDSDADDGNHYFQTPRDNASENATALSENT